MVEPPDFTSYLLCHLRNSLHPVTPDNARILRITAAAGTELADAFSPGTLPVRTRPDHCSPAKEVYDPQGLNPSRDLAGSGFRPLTNIPHCCPP